MKAVYKLTINDENIGMLQWYIDRNNEYENSTVEEQAEKESFHIEAMGAKHVLEFINNADKPTQIEADGSTVTIERLDNDVFVTLRGDRAVLTQTHPFGINAVLYEMLSNKYVELVEYDPAYLT